jgi:hypothetical protein
MIENETELFQACSVSEIATDVIAVVLLDCNG